jgi:hypothetical protein
MPRVPLWAYGRAALQDHRGGLQAALPEVSRRQARRQAGAPQPSQEFHR